MDKGGIVLIIISIVHGSKALAQKLTSNTELTRSHNFKNLSQHTALSINLKQSRLLLAINGSILHRKTVIPPVAIPHRKTVVPSKANPLFASVLAISGSIVLRKTAIPSVATPHRKTVVPSKANPLLQAPLQYASQKHRASKDGNPLGSNIAPKNGSPLEREPPTRKRKPRSGSNKENKLSEEEKVNDAIRHSHVNDAIRRLHAALT